MDADELTALIRRRIESRYRRIKTVCEELAKLDEKAQREKAKTKKPQTFEEFAFGSADFSRYVKIDKDEFSLLFREGLDDFPDSYFEKAFHKTRAETAETIAASYLAAGDFFVCKKPNPVILAVMRSLHTALDFAPLITPADFAGDEAQCRAVASALDGVVIRHDDGAETKLFADGASLCAAFHPGGKAWTVKVF